MPYRFDQRLAFAATLPSCYYTDPTVLTDENRKIFGRSWQLAGRSEQVREPGQYFTAVIGGEPVLVTRSADGVLRAMSNVCRHRAGPVAKGEGQRSSIQCRYHGWTYSLDGRLLGTPEMEGIECFDRDSVILPPFHADEWNGLVFVNLDPAAQPLREAFGALDREMPQGDFSGFRLAARKDWEIACNWKVYVDNYLEGYHIPIVHPGLFRELDYPNYWTETRDVYSIQHAPTRRGGAEVRYFWIYPNLMLNVYPDNFSTNLIVPLGHERTLTVFEWFFRQADAGRLTETISCSDEIQLEDIEICEAVQRGLRSATYTSGRYSPLRENGVHHFHALYAEAMGVEVLHPPDRRVGC